MSINEVCVCSRFLNRIINFFFFFYSRSLGPTKDNFGTLWVQDPWDVFTELHINKCHVIRTDPWSVLTIIVCCLHSQDACTELDISKFYGSCSRFLSRTEHESVLCVFLRYFGQPAYKKIVWCNFMIPVLAQNLWAVCSVGIFGLTRTSVEAWRLLGITGPPVQIMKSVGAGCMLKILWSIWASVECLAIA